jgi:hypothetical protein
MPFGCRLGDGRQMSAIHHRGTEKTSEPFPRSLIWFSLCLCGEEVFRCTKPSGPRLFPHVDLHQGDYVNLDQDIFGQTGYFDR